MSRSALIVIAAGAGLAFGYGAFNFGSASPFGRLTVAGDETVAGALFCAILAGVTVAVAYKSEQ